MYQFWLYQVWLLVSSASASADLLSVLLQVLPFTEEFTVEITGLNARLAWPPLQAAAAVEYHVLGYGPTRCFSGVLRQPRVELLDLRPGACTQPPKLQYEKARWKAGEKCVWHQLGARQCIPHTFRKKSQCARQFLLRFSPPSIAWLPKQGCGRRYTFTLFARFASLPRSTWEPVASAEAETRPDAAPRLGNAGHSAPTGSRAGGTKTQGAPAARGNAGHPGPDGPGGRLNR